MLALGSPSNIEPREIEEIAPASINCDIKEMEDKQNFTTRINIKKNFLILFIWLPYVSENGQIQKCLANLLEISSNHESKRCQKHEHGTNQKHQGYRPVQREKNLDIILKYWACNIYIPIRSWSFSAGDKKIYLVKATDIIIRHPPQLDPQPRFVGIASPSPHKHPQHIPTMLSTGISVNRPINPYPKYCLKYFGIVIKVTHCIFFFPH